MRILLKTVLLASACALGVSTAKAVPLAAAFGQMNTDFAQFGMGNLRDNGTGTLQVTGITGTVKKALLYWHGPTNAAQMPGVMSVDGNSVGNLSLGLASDNCWGFNNSQTWWGDVTSLITGNGNYAISAEADSRININGLSLLIFYDDGDPNNNRDIVVFHGNDSNIQSVAFGDPAGWAASLPGINYTSGTVSATLHVADTQSFSDDVTTFSAGAGVLNFPDAVGLMDGSNVQLGNGGDHNGTLWELATFDLTSIFSAGLNTLDLSGQGGAIDCLSCIALIIDLPEGAAPPIGVPEPATLGLAGFGLASLAFARRRQRRCKG